MNLTNHHIERHQITGQRRESGSYCPPESPIRLTLIMLASIVTGLLLTLLPSCDTHTEACAPTQQHVQQPSAQQVCR
jgi:hypothetical protein